MKSKLKLTLLSLALFCIAGIGSLNAQTEDDNKVTIKVTYEDKDGKKHTETKELIGEEASKFDLEAYKKELAENDMKLLTVDVTKEMTSMSKELHESKDHDVMIIKKGSDDQKRIKIVTKGDMEEKYMIKEMVTGEGDDVKKKKITVTALGDEMEGEEIEVEVKDGRVFINGEEVEDSETIDIKKGNRIIINSDDLDNEKNIHINKWVTEDGEHIELKGDGNEMIFISDGDHQKPRLGVMVEDGKEVNGAEVLDLVEDSPAAKAGIQKGDVLTAIDGKKVYGVTSLLAVMEELSEGDEVEVSYVRAGNEMKVKISLENLSDDHKIIKKKVIKNKEK